jgi:hypothetical protein
MRTDPEVYLMGVTLPFVARLTESYRRSGSDLILLQNGMLRRLGLKDNYDWRTTSGYERGERGSPLPVLLKYAKAANVFIDTIVDDTVDNSKHSAVRLSPSNSHNHCLPHASKIP